MLASILRRTTRPNAPPSGGTNSLMNPLMTASWRSVSAGSGRRDWCASPRRRMRSDASRRARLNGMESMSHTRARVRMAVVEVERDAARSESSEWCFGRWLLLQERYDQHDILWKCQRVTHRSQYTTSLVLSAVVMFARKPAAVRLVVTSSL